MSDNVKKLTNEQIESFDADFVQNHVGWDKIESFINKYFPDKSFTFLDIGGGNGVFADRILETYNKAEGIIIDNSKHLLNKNKPNSRKTIIECSVENMHDVFKNKNFDLIFFNWVLHHLVTDTYKDTIYFISNILKCAKNMLSERGKISILENCYISCSFESFPSRIIYHSLSSKLLISAVRKMGANTAGVGVCYFSEKLWCSMLENEGLKIKSCVRTGKLKTSLLKKILCHIKDINVVHIVCSQ